jgi:hypothetical protein
MYNSCIALLRILVITKCARARVCVCVCMYVCMYVCTYEGPLKSSWIHLITPSRNLWRCGDAPFFEVSPLVSDALLTTLHPLLENVLQTICCKLQDDSGTGGFDICRYKIHL